MVARCNQAAKRPLIGKCRVDMNALWIELLGKRQDIGLRNHDGHQLMALPHGKLLEIHGNLFPLTPTPPDYPPSHLGQHAPKFAPLAVWCDLESLVPAKSRDVRRRTAQNSLFHCTITSDRRDPFVPYRLLMGVRLPSPMHRHSHLLMMGRHLHVAFVGVPTDRNTARPIDSRQRLVGETRTHQNVTRTQIGQSCRAAFRTARTAIPVNSTTPPTQSTRFSGPMLNVAP